MIARDIFGVLEILWGEKVHVRVERKIFSCKKLSLIAAGWSMTGLLNGTNVKLNGTLLPF